MPKSGLLLFFWFNICKFRELLSSKSVQGKNVAFTTTLMLILLFCVIRGRILMPENAVNHVIYGSLWTTKTALNDFWNKMVENRIIKTAKFTFHCQL